MGPNELIEYAIVVFHLARRLKEDSEEVEGLKCVVWWVYVC